MEIVECSYRLPELRKPVLAYVGFQYYGSGERPSWQVASLIDPPGEVCSNDLGVALRWVADGGPMSWRFYEVTHWAELPEGPPSKEGELRELIEALRAGSRAADERYQARYRGGHDQ